MSNPPRSYPPTPGRRIASTSVKFMPMFTHSHSLSYSLLLLVMVFNVAAAHEGAFVPPKRFDSDNHLRLLAHGLTRCSYRVETLGLIIMFPSGRRYAFETMPTCSPISIAAIVADSQVTSSPYAYTRRLDAGRSFSHSRGNALRVNSFQAASVYDTHSSHACGFSSMIPQSIGAHRQTQIVFAGLAHCAVKRNVRSLSLSAPILTSRHCA